MSDCLTVDRRDKFVLITLNRPEARNSMSPELIVRLDAACVEARDDPTIRCVLIAATGESFCAGGDLKLTIPLLSGARPPETEYDTQLLELLKERQRPLPVYGDVGKPVIAIVDGTALGGGLELALACDIIVAGPKAKFAAPEVAAGAYPARLTYLLPKRVPFAVASDMLMACRSLKAEEAMQFGLVSRYASDGKPLELALQIAEKICANAPLSVVGARQVVRATGSAGLDEVRKLDREISKKVYASKDAREGPRAFAEKRAPQFTGT